MADETELVAKVKVTLRLPDVPLPYKLDLVAAALQAIRLAHADTMSAEVWDKINRAERLLAEATLAAAAARPQLGDGAATLLPEGRALQI